MQHGLYQSALLFTLQSMLCMAKGVEVVCLVNKSNLWIDTNYEYHDL